MKKIIDALKALQAVDDEVRSHAKERNDLTSQLDQLGALLERGQGELAEKQQKLSDVESFYREKNLKLKSDVERATRAKGKLAGITNQKEYLAAQRELETLRKTNATQEEEILKLLEAIEEYKSGIAADEEKLAALKKQYDDRAAASKGRLNELDAAISKINSRREEASAGLPKGTIRKYQRVLEGRDGMAVCEVIGGTCVGCNVQLPPQRFIELQRMDKLMNCPNCQRFIFVDPDSVRVNTESEVSAVG